jgi:hypothetical protein
MLFLYLSTLRKEGVDVYVATKLKRSTILFFSFLSKNYKKDLYLLSKENKKAREEDI